MRILNLGAFPFPCKNSQAFSIIRYEAESWRVFFCAIEETQAGCRETQQCLEGRAPPGIVASHDSLPFFSANSN